MTAQEIVENIRSDVQIFAKKPLRDGFTTDPFQGVMAGTNVLSQANRAYEYLVSLGFNQCFDTLTLTTGQDRYRLPGNFSEVHFADLYDGTTYVHDLPVGDVQQWRANRHSRRSGRPTEIAFIGSMFFTNTLPDKAYKIEMLVDSNPPRLALPTDVPSRLDDNLHWAIVSGGSYYIHRAALNMKTASEQSVIRFQQLVGEWKHWQGRVKEVANNRSIVRHGETVFVRDRVRRRS